MYYKLLYLLGKRLGKAGFSWLKLHCVNMTGHVKREPLSKRLEYAEDKVDDMIDSANHPFNGL